MSVNTKLPEEFVKLMEASVGMEASNIFIGRFNCCESDGAGRSGVTSIRINPFKDNCSILEGLSCTYELERVKWCNNGYYLNERPVFTLDPLFHAGAYYVQEASSMYMELVQKSIEADCLRRNGGGEFFGKDLCCLDLCAAPGGKSTHLASLIGKDSILVSNEVIRSRATVLADNIAKWGADNVVVTNNDPSDFKAFAGYFNLIVVDAPCSGEGLFIKEPEAINEWSLANVNLCAQRQQRILADIWPALAPGGYLVYSTCTYNKFENDGNLLFLRDVLGAEIIPVLLPEGSSIITTSSKGVQFVPGLVEGEGQFMAIVRKPFDEDIAGKFGGDESYGKMELRGSKKELRGKKGGKGDQTVVERGCNYLPSGYKMILQGELVKGYRETVYEKVRFVEANLRVVLSGIAVATKKGKDYVPHADFALQKVVSQMVAEDKLPAGIFSVEVGKEEALKFLAKEPVVFPDAPLGYVLLTYGGLGLGFVKNLGNRTNNLLPMARRIRMQIG